MTTKAQVDATKIMLRISMRQLWNTYVELNSISNTAVFSEHDLDLLKALRSHPDISRQITNNDI